MNEEVGASDIFESTFATFREWGTKGAGYDNVVWVFGKDRLAALWNVSLGRAEVALELRKT